MEDAVGRVRDALRERGHADTITHFPDGTRTAADAAAAVGCTLAQIAKSIVFRAGDRAVLVVASGANRIDKKLARAASGLKLDPADPAFVLASTGFAAGGVSPVGLRGAPVILLDRDLLTLGRIWAAAGSPSHVFETTGAALQEMTGGLVCAVAQGSEPAAQEG